MPKPLMPKATAVWLIDNTTLTFEQIGDLCELHSLEVQGIADEEVAVGIVGASPIETGELTQAEIARCQNDPSVRLVMAKGELPVPVARSKGPRYTPVSKRQDRPDAIAWLLTQHPELGDAQISRLVGTTKPTINAIRERDHWNMQNLKPQSPVKLGLCSQAELASDLAKAERAAARRAKREAKAAAAAAKAAGEPAAGEVPVAEAATLGPRVAEAATLGPGESESPDSVSPAPETPPALPSKWYVPLPATSPGEEAKTPVEAEPAQAASEEEAPHEEKERTEENG